MDREEMRAAVCAWAKRCYAEGLFAGTSGNLSVFDGEVLAITPTGAPYETMTPADIVLMTPGGEVLGAGRPSSEWRLHAALCRARPEVRAVVHTHSPYATASAVNRRPIPVVLIEMVPFLGGEVRVAPFALPGTEAVGTGAAAALEGRGACLLANHGAVAVGDTLETAHLRAVYLEDAAKICALAMANGPVAPLSDAEVAAMGGV